MSELLINYYRKNPYSYCYEINNNIIEHFDLSPSSIPLVSCVNSNSEIFYADNNIQYNPIWTLIPDKLMCICISNGQMFGVNSSSEIFYASNYKIYDWIKLPGEISQISFDGYANIVCGVNSSNQAYYADTDIKTNPNWTLFSSELFKSISFSNKSAFGIGMDDEIYYREDYKNSDWKNVTNGSLGALIQVSHDGYNNIVCCINASNKMYYANTNISEPNWTILPNCLFTSISVSNGHLYTIGTDNNIYYVDVYNIPILINVNQKNMGKIEQLSFDGYNLNTYTPNIISYLSPIVSCVNSYSQIYYAKAGIRSISTDWSIVAKIIAVDLIYVSISNGQIFGVNSGGDIYYSCDYKNPYWRKIPGVLSQISFDGYANVVCGVDSSYQVFYANTNIQTNPNWTNYKSGILLKSISLSNEKAFGIGVDDNIYCTEDYKDTPWIQVNNGLAGSIIQVSYDGYKNIVCCIDSTNQMYYANTDITTNPNWTIVPSALFKSISVSNGHLYAIGTDNNYYYIEIYNDLSSSSKFTNNNIGNLTQFSFDGYYKITFVRPISPTKTTPLIISPENTLQESTSLETNNVIPEPTSQKIQSNKTPSKIVQTTKNNNLPILIIIIVILAIFAFIYFTTR